MNKRRVLRLLIISGFCLFGFYVFKSYAKTVKDEHCLITQISARVFDFNSFEIQVSEKLIREDFKIVHKNSGKVIFINGRNRTGISNNYGRCSFDIYYQNEKVCEVGYFKKNNWETNDYLLTLNFTEKGIEPMLKIVGSRAVPYRHFIRGL